MRSVRDTTVLALLALLALASACAPVDYVPPEPEQPLGPLSMEAAVELALRNNPDVIAAEERVQAARGAIDEASSYYWPVLRLVEEFTQTDRPSHAFGNILDQGEFRPTLDFNDPGVTSNFRSGIGGSITLYDGGRRRARVSAAQAHAASEVARAERTRRDLALEIARAFFLIHKAEETATMQERSLETLATHVRIAEARLAEGAAQRSDVLAVRVRQAETREAVIVARNSAARARAGLHVLLGLGVAEEIPLVRPVVDEVEPPPTSSTAFESARHNRFELVEAESQVVSAQARLEEVWAGYFPDVTLFGSVGFDDESLDLSDAHWTWGVSIAEDVFDALRTPTRVRQAFAGLKAAHAELRKARLSVELDVRNASLDAAEADARFDVSRQAAELAAESLRLVEIEYQEGAADISRLLDAELALTRARTRLEAAKYDRALSRVAIAHAVGEYPTPPERPADSEEHDQSEEEE